MKTIKDPSGIWLSSLSVAGLYLVGHGASRREAGRAVLAMAADLVPTP